MDVLCDDGRQMMNMPPHTATLPVETFHAPTTLCPHKNILLVEPFAHTKTFCLSNRLEPFAPTTFCPHNFSPSQHSLSRLPQQHFACRTVCHNKNILLVEPFAPTTFALPFAPTTFFTPPDIQRGLLVRPTPGPLTRNEETRWNVGPFDRYL